MKSGDKKLLKIKPDEVIIYKKRLNGKLVTMHKISIIHGPFNSKKHLIVYNGGKTGMGTKTQILNRLRQVIT